MNLKVLGRKKINIDWKVVDEMLSDFCDGTEVADFLGITEDTLYNRIKEVYNLDFSAYKAQKRAKGCRKLRQLQMDLAREKDKIMLIWLGKQYLNQSEKTDISSKGESLRPLNIVVDSKETMDIFNKLINEPISN